MKRTVRLSLGMCFIMLALVLIAPHLASPKLVLRFLPKDVYESGKDHPSPSLSKRLLCHLLLAMAAAYVPGIVCCSGIYTDEEQGKWMINRNQTEVKMR